MMGEPRSVVITGASRGLGLASATHLYKLGWCIVAAMRSPQVGLERLIPLSTIIVRRQQASDGNLLIGGLEMERHSALSARHRR